MRRTVGALLYLTILVGETTWTAIVPLIPLFSRRFHLSTLEVGVVLASSSLTILLVSLPAGTMAGRVGTRWTTLAGVGVMAAADVAFVLADGFWSLVVARVLFGVGFGVLWSAGIAWLGEAAGERQAEALSYTVAVAGVGGVVGPGFAGVVAERFGLAAPFLLTGGAVALLLVGLLVDRSGTGRVTGADQPVSEILRAARSERHLQASIAISLLGALVWSVMDLLVPLALHRNGLSPGMIGVAFSAASAVFILGSVVIARTGERSARLGVGAAWAALIACALSVAVASGSTPALISLLFGASLTTAGAIAITYPLGVVGARSTQIPIAAVAGVLNMAWALAGLVGPLAAGSLTQLGGAKVAWAMLAASAALVATWLTAARGGAARSIVR